MALTQISTGGVKNDAVTAGKIPANAVGSSEIADDAVDQGAIADEAVDEARLQISNAGTNGQFLQKQSGNTGGLTWAAANEYTHPNHSGEVTSTADGAQVIASEVVDEDNLKISNAGTNGQYLQKQSGNTGGLTWADVTIPPSGNTVDLVADGAIAAGKPCIIKSNGKVAQISSPEALATPVSGSNGNNGVSPYGSEVSNIKVVYHAAADRYVAVWGQDAGTNNKDIDAVVYQVNTSTGAITCGSKVTIDSDDIAGWFGVMYEPDSEKIVVTYSKDSNWQMKTVVGTVDASTNGISFGSVTTNGSNNFAYQEGMCYEPGQDKVIQVYNDTNAGHGKIVAGTISGTSISWGTIFEYGGSNYRKSRVVPIGNNRVVICTNRNGNTSISYFTLSLSGSTFSAVNQGTVESNAEGIRLIKVDTNKVLISFKDDANNGTLYSKLGTVASDGSITWETKFQVNSDNNLNRGHDLVWSSTHNAAVYHYQTGSNTKARYATISGTTVTLGTEGTVHTGAYRDSIKLSDTSGKWVSYGAYNPGNSRTELYTFKFLSPTTNITDANHYIGFADQAYSDGQTATINTYGNTVNTLSGLTTGSIYYVQADGTVGTSWDSSGLSSFASNTPVAGIALSATKLLIREPRAMN